jgi:hypothetical protein
MLTLKPLFLHKYVNVISKANISVDKIGFGNAIQQFLHKGANVIAKANASGENVGFSNGIPTFLKNE